MKNRLKHRRLKRNIIVLFMVLFFLWILNFKTGFLSYSNSQALTANEMNMMDDRIFKNPVIKTLERDISQVVKEEAEKRAAEERAKQEEADRNKKIAYLTFDDGPSDKNTDKILDILKEENIEATFFILGSMAERNPETLKRIYNEGHGIGHHSYTHNYKHIYSSPERFMEEIRRTDELFSKILGDEFETKLLRFPGGEFGKKKNNYAKIANKEGYVSHNWNALNGDSEGHNLSTNYLLNRLKSTVGNQKKVTILMHDTDAKSTTVTSLPESIRYLKSKGYEFRKIAQPEG